MLIIHKSVKWASQIIQQDNLILDWNFIYLFAFFLKRRRRFSLQLLKNVCES